MRTSPPHADLPLPTTAVPAARVAGPAAGLTVPRAPLPRPVWSIQLLGGAHVRRQGGPPQQLVHRSVAVLLARLAMSPGGCVGREELVELLWPDVAPDTGRARLRRTLSRLRAVLGPQEPEPALLCRGAVLERERPAPASVLYANRHTVQLCGDSVDCDVLAFERAVRAGAFEDARALYLGDLLPGCYDEWVVEERARLADLRTRLPTTWLTVGAGGTTAAAAASTMAAAALAATGPPRTAVRPPRLARLPLSLSTFFGREVELAQLLTLVQGSRCVTLTGPVGCGKSRLALQAARCSRGFDSVVWVPLGQVSDGTRLLEQLRAALHSGDEPALVPPSQVWGTVAGQSTFDGVQDAVAGPSTFDAVVAALRGQRALLVFDDAEQVVDTGGADAVLALLGAVPSLHAVLTLRRTLRIDGERVIALQGLPVSADGSAAEPATPAEALAIPAVALFVDRARNVLGRFEPDMADCADVLSPPGRTRKTLVGRSLLRIVATRPRHGRASPISAHPSTNLFQEPT